MRARPLWRACRHIRIGITCSGTPSSARRPVTAQPAARPLSEICCRVRIGRTASRWIPPDIAEQISWDLFGLITGLPAETARIPWDGPRVRIIEHQAHAAGHAALLIEERGVLVAGDILSDALIPMLDLNDAADPTEDYLAALRLIEGVAGDVDVLVPGHGSIAEPIRYAHGSTRSGRTCRPCVTPVLLTTRGSAHRPRSIGCPACMNGN
jgi:glyoxylase-like metal-dependent hydrolase (beta-lactamase superfamily II)